MKRTVFLCLLIGGLVLSQLKAQAQEVIGVGGYGYNQTSKDFNETGDYFFGEARLMLKLKENFRVGPYLGYVVYGNETPISDSSGREFKYGVSVDSYGPTKNLNQYYFWNSLGLKSVRDNYSESLFDSETKTNLIFLEGGLSFARRNYGWFSHHQGTWSYQHPVGKEKIEATWDGNSVSSEPWNKQSLRLTLESGVINFGGKVLRAEPLLKVGYGHEFGREMSYYEYGGGFALGIYKRWYREIFKVTVFKRQDFKKIEGNPSGRLNAELVLNVTALTGLIYK